MPLGLLLLIIGVVVYFLLHPTLGIVLAVIGIILLIWSLYGGRSV